MKIVRLDYKSLCCPTLNCDGNTDSAETLDEQATPRINAVQRDADADAAGCDCCRFTCVSCLVKPQRPGEKAISFEFCQGD